MIALDFLIAVAVYLFLVILLVIGHWIFYNFNSYPSRVREASYLEQCPYCAYIFFDYTKNKLKACPRCESYIAYEETKK